MARFRNVNTGALVDVREDKALGSEWEPVKAQAQAKTEEKSSTSRRGSTKSDSKS